MTEKQIRWREALTIPLTSSKTKQAAVVGLVNTNISPLTLLAWARMGAVKPLSK